MKLRDLILIVALMMIQSCQNTTIELDKFNNRPQKAALYNTQLGLAYLKQGDRVRAKQKLLKALTQNPKSPDVNASMAYFLEQSGEMHNAQIYYRKAIYYSSEHGAQLNNYGAFLCRRGHYDRAEVYFMRAARDVNYENTGRVYENAGLCAEASKDKPKAIRYFIKALEHDPSQKQSLYELVNIKIKQGHNDQALTYLQKYSALTGSDSTLLEMAANTAHSLRKNKLEAYYKSRLQHRS